MLRAAHEALAQAGRADRRLRALPGVGPEDRAAHGVPSAAGGPRRRALSRRAPHRCARTTSGRCRRCRMLTDSELCSDLLRRASAMRALLCVVESPADVVAVEQSGSYRGRYFVLHGASVAARWHRSGADRRAASSKRPARSGGQVREVILATNPTVEGEATAHFLSELAGAARQCRRAASRTACPWAASSNTWMAERWHALAGRQSLG